MHWFRGPGAVSLPRGSVDESDFPVSSLWSSFYRGSLLVLTLLGFVAHVCIQGLPGLRASGPLLSNLAQVWLGILTILAMLEARKQSSRFGSRTWLLAALAATIHTAGQAVFTYNFGLRHSAEAGALVYDPLLFFWIVPLLAAAMAHPSEIAEGFEWSAILDFSLLVLLALAVDLSVFTDASRWQGHPSDLLFWRLKIRVFRDVIVLGCLWGRVFLAGAAQTRALFLRLSAFYFVYALGNALEHYYRFTRAPHPADWIPWIDLVWSVPRVVIVFLALTWRWRGEIPEHREERAKWSRYLLSRTPLVAPLLVLAVSSRLFSSQRWIWAGLIGAALVIVSMRLRLTQFRQERAVDRLHASTNLLHSIIEGTSECVYLKDAQGRYLLMNAAGARLLGRSPEEIVGKTDRDLFPAQEAAVILREDREVLDSGQAVTAETVLTSQGSPRIFLTTKNPYRDPQGRLIGVLGISVDVTERRHMEERLQKAQRMESIGTFSSGMAHDFNNLLTVIKGYSYLAQADAGDHASARENLEQINKAAGRAASLVDQLLAFSRQQILQPRVIDLNDIVSHLRKMLERLIGEDVSIHTHLAPGLGAVKADPCQIEQVLMNLAANARDAMPGGGDITVETANVNLNRSNCGADLHVPPGAYVRLTVTDTGIGMDAHTRARIFEPFFTTKPPGKGTGLGLATAYGIIKQSGGYLSADSEPERGAAFRIYLPRAQERVEPLAPVTARRSAGGANQTILVVDDDAQVRRLAKKVLATSGFTVLEADSGEQAQQLADLHAGGIDMLLTDVVMPGASGREIARRICQEGSKTRVLYMSGYPDDTIAHHGVLASGISLLQKPFSPDRLVEKVREVLAPASEASPGVA